MDLGQVAEPDRAKEPGGVGGVGATGGQPLPARLEGRVASCLPGTVRARVVGVGAARPGAVGELVVIDRRDHRQRRVQALHVGVRAILGVATAIVRQRPALAVGIEWAADVGAGGLPLRGPI